MINKRKQTAQPSMTRMIANQPVRVVFSSGQAEMAQEVLKSLERFAAQRPLLAGARMRFGWSLLTLGTDTQGGLLVCEPNFAGNPLTELRSSIATTLEVLAQQVRLMHRLEVQPAEVSFEQYLVVRLGALAETKVNLLRDEPTSADDSGWSITPDAGADRSEDEEDYEAVQVYQLLTLRPAALAALTLPPGYVVALNGNKISAIFDPQGNERLNQ
jgi:hypothetical protein